MKHEIEPYIAILLAITSVLMPLLSYKLGIQAGKKEATRKSSSIFRHHQSYLSHDR